MKKVEKNQQNIEKIVKETISGMLGIEISDINQNDDLSDDLHMGPAEITDLAEKLSQRKIFIPEVALKEIKTVEDLINYIADNADL